MTYNLVAMGVEVNGDDTEPSGYCLIDVPVVIGSISRHIGGEEVGGNDGYGGRGADSR